MRRVRVGCERPGTPNARSSESRAWYPWVVWSVVVAVQVDEEHSARRTMGLFHLQHGQYVRPRAVLPTPASPAIAVAITCPAGTWQG